MKKLLCLLLCLVCLPTFALAEVDLDSLTFVELIELREQITAEITSRPEWKEVFVPAGVYEVGVDIPAGRWTLTLADTEYFGYTYGNVLNETKTDVSYSADLFTSAYASSKEYIMHSAYPQESLSIEIQEGNFIVIVGNCYFTPYIRPTLGF